MAKLTYKEDGQGLTGSELNYQHGFIATNLMAYMERNIGSPNIPDVFVNNFGSDYQTISTRFLTYGTGSYATPKWGSVFFVLIECGSIANPGAFAVNGCVLNQIATGSYIYMGPDNHSLGSSRAKLMQSLFSNQLIGSASIGNLTGIKVSTNAFTDVGKRGYRHTVSISGGVSVGHGATLDFESNAGSVWSWSNMSTTDGGAANWQLPTGTTLNSIGGNSTSNEIGLDLSADVKINPSQGKAEASVNAGDPDNVGVEVIVITTGSINTSFSGGGTGTVTDYTGNGVPRFGSLSAGFGSTTSSIEKIIGLIPSGSSYHGFVCADFGSYHPQSTVRTYLSLDYGSTYKESRHFVDKIGAMSNTGSIVIKIEIDIANEEKNTIHGTGVWFD